MCRNLICGAVVVLVGTLGLSTAEAITIGGQNYEKVLSLGTGNETIGYWESLNKYYTHTATAENVPISVHSIDFASSDIATDQIEKVYAMGTTIGNYGPVNAGVVEILGVSGQKLLTASLIPNGTVTATRVAGPAGHFQVSGLYNITGGLFAVADALTGPLYIDFVFASGGAMLRRDSHYTNGTFHFYRPSEGGQTEVPEPGTVMLLASGLLGLRRNRVSSIS